MRYDKHTTVLLIWLCIYEYADQGMCRAAEHMTPVQVGEMLERPSAWPHFQHLQNVSTLQSALETFNEERGHPRERMPLLADLVSAGREDLVRAIAAAGLMHDHQLYQQRREP